MVSLVHQWEQLFPLIMDFEGSFPIKLETKMLWIVRGGGAQVSGPLIIIFIVILILCGMDCSDSDMIDAQSSPFSICKTIP